MLSENQNRVHLRFKFSDYGLLCSLHLFGDYLMSGT